jgi:signal recognition particle subunit SRP54
MERVAALIQSMTPGERAKPSIITPARKRRIAKGSGNTVADVNRLLDQFNNMQKMMKQFGLGKGGKAPNMTKMARQMRNMQLPGGMKK